MRRKSAEEAHEFEREIEKDAFLYEAVEGFEEMMASEIQQALDELDDRLDEKVKKRFAFVWWQAAAVGAVIVVGAAGVLLTGGEETTTPSNPIVEEEFETEPIRLKEAPIEHMDTSEAVATLDDGDFGSAPKTLDQASESPALRAESPDAGFTDEEAIGYAVQAEDLEIRSDSDEPKEEVDADVALVSEEVESLASDEAPGYTREAIDKSKVQPSAAKRVGEMSYENDDVLRAKPIGGMAAYQSYLRNGIQTSSGMPNGFVVLSFEFDRDGGPKKITVDKSLCTACDAEAIRLVTAGPKWNAPNRKERMTLQVRFP